MSESFVNAHSDSFLYAEQLPHQRSVTLSYNLQMLDSHFILAMHMAQHVGNAGDKTLEKIHYKIQKKEAGREGWKENTEQK